MGKELTPEHHAALYQCAIGAALAWRGHTAFLLVHNGNGSACQIPAEVQATISEADMVFAQHVGRCAYLHCASPARRKEFDAKPNTLIWDLGIRATGGGDYDTVEAWSAALHEEANVFMRHHGIGPIGVLSDALLERGTITGEQVLGVLKSAEGWREREG
jgi:hypothetical protein